MTFSKEDEKDCYEAALQIFASAISAFNSVQLMLYARVYSKEVDSLDALKPDFEAMQKAMQKAMLAFSQYEGAVHASDPLTALDAAHDAYGHMSCFLDSLTESNPDDY